MHKPTSSELRIRSRRDACNVTGFVSCDRGCCASPERGWRLSVGELHTIDQKSSKRTLRTTTTTSPSRPPTPPRTKIRQEG